MPRLLLALALAAAPRAHAAVDKQDQVYKIEVLDKGARLLVTASFGEPAGAGLGVTREAMPFVKDFAVRSGGAWKPTAPEKACGIGPCEVRYEFRLADAAKAIDQPDLASGEGGAWMAGPGVFLVRASDTWADARARFSFSPANAPVACGAFEGDGGYVAPADSLTDLPVCVFGDVKRERLPVTGGVIESVFWPGPKLEHPDAVKDWVTRAEKAVVAYYGRYPVSKLLLLIHTRAGKGGGGGMTYGAGGAFISVTVGAASAASDLADDWMLTHEMTHLTLPSVPRRHHWLEEGMATYVEPFARVLTGELTAAKVWGDVTRDIGKGQPEKGDEGLDHTATWGRTYWGGALFFLVADVKIREATANKKGLREALAGIVAGGGNVSQDWPIDAVLAAGDKAVGVAVLAPLYAEMKDAPVTVDLAALWKKLGIAGAGAGVKFDDSAPGAAIRKAIGGP